MSHQQQGRFTPPTIRQFRCDVPILAQDRVDIRSAASAFKRAKALVKRYGSRLRKIARDIDSLVKHYDVTTPEGQSLLQAAFTRYRDHLTPYAEASADKMLAEVAKADERDWRKMSAEIGRGVEKAVASAPVAPVIEAMKQEQIRLIRSLPEDAAERVHRIVVEGLSTGRRASDIADEIYKTGAVTRARADLIASTEVGRASTNLQMARALNIGSNSYVWRTMRDGSVRHDHEILDGKVFRWDSPPIADRRTGTRAHPGCIYRCRCFASPLVDG